LVQKPIFRALPTIVIFLSLLSVTILSQQLPFCNKIHPCIDKKAHVTFLPIILFFLSYYTPILPFEIFSIKLNKKGAYTP
jgi:hypothetical protein